jgi:hypothetical protein
MFGTTDHDRGMALTLASQGLGKGGQVLPSKLDIHLHDVWELRWVMYMEQRSVCSQNDVTIVQKAILVGGSACFSLKPAQLGNRNLLTTVGKDHLPNWHWHMGTCEYLKNYGKI